MVGIIGVIAAMGVPMVYRILHKEPLRKAVEDVFSVCEYARREAILHNDITRLVIYPREGRIEVARGAAVQTEVTEDTFSLDQPTRRSGESAKDGSTAQFDEIIFIEDLDINKVPGGFLDAEKAYVHFFPNGTCDEMSLIIRLEDHWRQIKLEVTTGLPSVETNPREFR